jgi:hypothetical protein
MTWALAAVVQCRRNRARGTGWMMKQPCSSKRMTGTGRALAWTLKTAAWAGMIWPIRQSWPTSSSMPRRADLKLSVCRDAVSAGGRAA